MSIDWERPTSCQCATSGMPPCGWCERDARECQRCGAILDRDDVLPSGYCEPCDLNRFIAEAVLGSQDVPDLDRDTMAMFGLDDNQENDDDNQ